MTEPTYRCMKCRDQGVVYAPPVPPFKVPGTRMCECQLKDRIIHNVERGWRGLVKAPNIPTTPLLGKLRQDCWVTATHEVFRQHLKHAAVRQHPNWHFRVVTDADLMSAWLATAIRPGKEIYDVDVQELDDVRALAELVCPPDLLVIRLGVKVAPNKAMADVLLEGLCQREHEGRPTWVWDQPEHPLAEGHKVYSSVLMEMVRGWSRVKLDAAAPALKPTTPRPAPRPTPKEGAPPDAAEAPEPELAAEEGETPEPAVQVGTLPAGRFRGTNRELVVESAAPKKWGKR